MTITDSASCMLHDFHIRDYSPADYEAVIALWESIGLGGRHRGDNREVINRTLQSGGTLLLMEALPGKEIIGTSWLTNDGRRSYLHHFGIAEPWQGKGLSKQLLEESMQVAGKTGYQVKLEVHRSNIKAVKLYEQAGFSCLGDYDVYIVRDLAKNL